MTTKNMISPRNGVLAIMILSAGVFRLATANSQMFLSDFTPIGAMALFGGCYFVDKWKAYLVPLLTLWITDLVLNYALYLHHWTWFYNGFAWTYGSFALVVLMGTFIKQVRVTNVLLLSILAAVLHWVITDFGVWAGESMYTKNFAGLMECYAAAIPYLRNLIVSSVLFSSIMFGAFEWAKFKFPALEVSKA